MEIAAAVQDPKNEDVLRVPPVEGDMVGDREAA